MVWIDVIKIYYQACGLNTNISYTCELHIQGNITFYTYSILLELPWGPLKDNETIVLDGSDELAPTGRTFDIVDDLLAGCGRG